jgi:hypothetical protein
MVPSSTCQYYHTICIRIHLHCMLHSINCTITRMPKSLRKILKNISPPQNKLNHLHWQSWIQIQLNFTILAQTMQKTSHILLWVSKLKIQSFPKTSGNPLPCSLPIPIVLDYLHPSCASPIACFKQNLVRLDCNDNLIRGNLLRSAVPYSGDSFCEEHASFSQIDNNDEDEKQ